MTTGTEAAFNILRQSPHDQNPVEEKAAPTNLLTDWVSSRYNVQARTADGRLVLWNTYWGSISVFKAEERETIQKLIHKQGFSAHPEGIVEYLARRGYIIRKGTDELARFRFDFGRQHYRNDLLEMILMASEDCNLRCSYCYEKFTRGTMRPDVRAGIKKLVEDRILSIRHLSVGWFGGEPLYGWEALEDLAPFFLEKVEEHSLSYHSHMTTNGYLLTSEVAEKLLLWQVRKFQITLDGPEEFHDRSRPGRDGSPTFATILGNLKNLQRRPEEFQVDIRVNFDQNNQPAVFRLIDTVADELLGDPRFRMRFYPVGRWGGANDGKLEVCGIGEVETLKTGMKSAAREKGVPLSDDLKRVNRFGTQVCYAARPNHFVIGADGKVMKCTVALAEADYNVVGEVTALAGLQLDRDKMALWTNPAYDSDDQCQKCVVMPLCQGISCPWVRIRSQERPCIPMRTNPKSEMLALAEGTPVGRQVHIEAPAATALH